jgi:hypothetical protein
MKERKKSGANAYMSVRCDVTDVASKEAFRAIDFENYVIKAAAKSFSKVFEETEVNVAQVIQNSIGDLVSSKFYKAAN